MKIGILAPSSKVPAIELKLGINKLLSAGLDPVVHPQCKKEDFFFAGSDAERFQAFVDFALNPEIKILWAARGGYGAVRLLPLLKKWAEKNAKPSQKLFIGYSDSTAVMEFARTQWGWPTLHAPMPSWRRFSLLKGKDWEVLLKWIHQIPSPPPWETKKLEFWSHPLKQAIRAPLIGGNLSVWSSLVGTAFLDVKTPSFLFLEDLEEPFYRIDRMLQQLALSGSLNSVQAIVLGTFFNCQDTAPQVLKKMPNPKQLSKFLLQTPAKDLKPLRKLLRPEKKGLQKIFGELGSQRSIPIAYGLPVGHGPEISLLPLGQSIYELNPSGHLSLKSWDWLKSPLSPAS